MFVIKPSHFEGARTGSLPFLWLRSGEPNCLSWVSHFAGTKMFGNVETLCKKEEEELWEVHNYHSG